jgi:hypothetical protein
MNAKNLALVVLAVTTLAAAVLAWRQQLELQSLRAVAAAADDAARMKQRALAAEQRAKALEDELSAAQDKLAEAKSAAAKAEAAKRPADAGSMPAMRTMLANAANMMSSPEVQKMMALRQKAALDANYAALFKRLSLPPEKLEQLKKLMVERQQVGADVFAAAAQQGLDPLRNGRELAKLTADGQARVDGEIKALLGEDAYATYQNYQNTLPQRGVVNQLQQSLSYTANPLSETQAEQLVQILAQNQPAQPAGATGRNVAVARTFVAGGAAGGGAPEVMSYVGPAMGVGGSTVTDAAVAAARTVLSDPQVEALQQIQQQQAQLRATMQSMGGGLPGSGGAAILQFNATTDGPAPAHPMPPPAGDKPPGGE